MMRSIYPLAIALVAVAGCGRGGKPADLEAREKAVKQRISQASPDDENMAPVAKWILPDVLREISGIALTSDGRIVAHNDERSRVFVIDPLRGVIMKQFSVGKKGMTADFEAIAVSGEDFFLLTSNGDVYQFREGDDNAVVPFTKHATDLGKECEFEGLQIEPRTGAFLLACKNIKKKSERNQLLIYRWLKQDGGTAQVSRISIPLAAAIGSNDWKALSPSDLALDSRTGNYVLVAGPEKALIEVTPAGEVVRSMPLPGDPQQPEGVAITREGLLIVSDESVTRPADITIYAWPRPGGAAVVPVADSVRADSTLADTTTTGSN